mgnify:CR=1 FL=1
MIDEAKFRGASEKLLLDNLSLEEIFDNILKPFLQGDDKNILNKPDYDSFITLFHMAVNKKIFEDFEEMRNMLNADDMANPMREEEAKEYRKYISTRLENQQEEWKKYGDEFIQKTKMICKNYDINAEGLSECMEYICFADRKSASKNSTLDERSDVMYEHMWSIYEEIEHKDIKKFVEVNHVYLPQIYILAQMICRLDERHQYSSSNYDEGEEYWEIRKIAGNIAYSIPEIYKKILCGTNGMEKRFAEILKKMGKGPGYVPYENVLPCFKESIKGYTVWPVTTGERKIPHPIELLTMPASELKTSERLGTLLDLLTYGGKDAYKKTVRIQCINSNLRSELRNKKKEYHHNVYEKIKKLPEVAELFQPDEIETLENGEFVEFADVLNYYLKKKELKKKDICKSNRENNSQDGAMKVPESVYRQSVDGKIVQRDSMIAMLLRLEPTLMEFELMFESAGFVLSQNNLRDVVIKSLILSGETKLDRINEILDKVGLDKIQIRIKSK